jgi:NADH-quinone oxidoreductase subunit G
LTVSTARGSVTLPVLVADLPDGAVFVPTNSPGSTVRRSLAAGGGALVKLTAAGGAA